MPTAEYGTWASPITAAALAGTTVGLSGVTVDGDHVYWLESHPEQAGRTALWRQPLTGGPASMTLRPAGRARAVTATRS